MADTKISDLAAVTDLQDTDEFVLARAGTSKKIDAVDLRANLRTVVTSLPGSPADGDELYLQVGSGDTAVLWHLKYESSITDAYKWRFLGGAPLYDEQVSSSTLSSGTYSELDSGNPQVTLPTIGVYDVAHGAAMTGANHWGLVNIKTNGSNPGSDDMCLHSRNDSGGTATTTATGERPITVASISTSALMVQVYRTGASTSFLNRWLKVIPVRLG